MNAQSFVVKGRVFSHGGPLVAANIYLNTTAMGVTNNLKAAFPFLRMLGLLSSPYQT